MLCSLLGPISPVLHACAHYALTDSTVLLGKVFQKQSRLFHQKHPEKHFHLLLTNTYLDVFSTFERVLEEVTAQTHATIRKCSDTHNSYNDMQQ